MHWTQALLASAVFAACVVGMAGAAWGQGGVGNTPTSPWTTGSPVNQGFQSQGDTAPAEIPSDTSTPSPSSPQNPANVSSNQTGGQAGDAESKKLRADTDGPRNKPGIFSNQRNIVGDDTLSDEQTANRMDSGWLGTLAALGLVVGSIFGLRWLWQKMGGQVTGPGSSHVVEVLSRTSVAPRNHVMLLKVGSRVLVVSETPAGTRTLTEFRDDEEVADLLTQVESAKANSFSAGFREAMSDFNQQYNPLERMGNNAGNGSRQGFASEGGPLKNLLQKVRGMNRQSGEVTDLSDANGQGMDLSEAMQRLGNQSQSDRQRPNRRGGGQA